MSRVVPMDCVDYVSCGNGQDVYDVKNNVHRLMPMLRKEEVKDIIAPMDRHLVVMSVHGNGVFRRFAHPSKAWYGCLVMAVRLMAAVALRRRWMIWKIETDYGFLKDMEPAKICFSGTHLSLKRYLSDLEPDKYSHSFVNPYWLEMQSKGVSKGNAVQWIQLREGISREETACAGDGENDLSMMEHCAIRIVPANAMKSVKAIATEHVTCWKKEGVPHWLEEHLLEEE